MGKGKRVPSYRRHSSGQARVTIRGRDIMLGPYDSEESRAKYGRLIAEYLASDGSASFGVEPESLFVGDLVADYLVHAKTYFGDTTEGKNVKRALTPVAKLYMDLPAIEFGPLQFKAVRADWMADKRPTKDRQKTDKKPACKMPSRGYVNAQMSRVLRFLKWAVGEGKIPSSVYDACKCVPSLRKGKCDLDDTEPIKPVSVALVEATLKHLTQVVADMVRFQLYTGCRPGEVVKIKPSMIDRSGEVWIVNLQEHKTAWRKHEHRIYIGPRAQAVITPYLFRSPDDYCFSPRESERQRLDAKHAERVTPLSCGNRPGWNLTRKPKVQPGLSFTTGSYTNSIRNACKRAKLEHWCPLQLRHTRATEIRKQFGIEASQLILGHQDIGVTQVYAERDQQKAIDIARKIG